MVPLVEVDSFQYENGSETENQVGRIDRNVADGGQQGIYSVVASDSEAAEVEQGGRHAAGDIESIAEIVRAEEDPGEGNEAIGEQDLPERKEPGDAGDPGPFVQPVPGGL